MSHLWSALFTVEAVATAMQRRQYELAALRLLLGVTAALQRAEAAAPEARDALVALLTVERP